MAIYIDSFFDELNTEKLTLFLVSIFSLEKQNRVLADRNAHLEESAVVGMGVDLTTAELRALRVSEGLRTKKLGSDPRGRSVQEGSTADGRGMSSAGGAVTVGNKEGTSSSSDAVHYRLLSESLTKGKVEGQ